MIITLAGLPGAGKSTVKQLLAQRLGWKAYGMGDLRGKYALEQGITIDELNERGMTDPTTDSSVDAFAGELGKTEDEFIVDGWVAWHFIPQSFKVFLTIDPAVGAQRIYDERHSILDSRSDEPMYESVAQAQEIIGKRVEQNRARFEKWYQIDFLDLNQYDLVLDTTHMTPEEVTQRVLDAIPALPRS